MQWSVSYILLASGAVNHGGVIPGRTAVTREWTGFGAEQWQQANIKANAMSDSTWSLVIIAFAITAGLGDLWFRKIPRWLTISGFLAGLLFQWSRGHLLGAVEAAALAFLIGLLAFFIGAIGGGDVKLMTALAAMRGLHPWLEIMWIALLAAALMGILQVIRHRKVRQTIHNVAEIFRHFGRNGFNPHPEINVNNPAMVRSPFGLAVAIGVLASAWIS